MLKEIGPSKLTYDDVLLQPGYSEVLPKDIDLSTPFSRNISLKIPLISAAMDTVTESLTAIVLAQEGGMGIIHRNLSPEEQALEVQRVKKFEAGIIVNPITVAQNDPLDRVITLMNRYKVNGFPVISDHKLVGIITHRDIRFESNFKTNTKKVSDIMTSATSSKLVTAPWGTSLSDAKSILAKYKVEKLPLVDSENTLKGLITAKDIEKSKNYPLANKDSFGRLRVAAAISVSEKEYWRALKLIEKEVDALVIDTAHAHSLSVFEMIRVIKSKHPKVELIVGNVATSKACEDLIKENVDGIKIGIGPGSICTTRIVAGIGVPQLSALMDCSQVCHQAEIPYIADGGIKFSGDIVKALASGANSVMIGQLFAGTDEAPGELVLWKGRTYKTYRGMGSIGAMNRGGGERYQQASIEDHKKFVPEGIEGQIPYRGTLSSNIYQLIGGVKSGMGYVGAQNIKELQEKGQFIKISKAALHESHPHQVIITKEAPNYKLS